MLRQSHISKLEVCPIVLLKPDFPITKTAHKARQCGGEVGKR